MTAERIDITEINKLLYTLSDNDIVTLPSGKVASIREMTGHEQRNFMNRAKLTNGTAVQELLAACTLSIDDVPLPDAPDARNKFVLDMLSADRQALMFGIRRHSLGDVFRFTTQCPSCRTSDTWEVDLSDASAFPVTPCPKGDDREFAYSSTVRSGLVIKFKLLDGNAELSIIRKRDAVDLLTDLEMRQPKALAKGADDVDTWVPVALNRCSDTLIAEMRRQVRDAEGKIQSTVKVICKNCQSEVEFDLLQLPDFMTPSVIS